MDTGETPMDSRPSRGVRRVLKPGARPALSGAAPEAAGDAEGRLLRPAAACPRCGARPALRVTAAMVRAVDAVPAHVRVGTYQCQRRGCGAIYDINVGAYQRAS